MNIKRIKERFILLRPVLLPFIVYLGTVILISIWIEGHAESSAAVWVALVPLFPSLWITAALIQFLKKLDELERRIIYEAAAFSFTITLLMMLAFTFLSVAGVAMPHPTVIVYFMAFLLLVGKLNGNRKYK